MLSLLLVALPAWPAAASPDNLDVVIVIDQSGSMSGNKAHPAANDPEASRLQVAKLILSRLAKSVENTALVHRVSIIEFGSTVEVPVSLLELKHNIADPGRAAADAANAGDRLVSRDLEDTHTHEALAAAATELRAMARLPDDGSPRKRHVILLTDGHPYAEAGRTPLKDDEVWRLVEREVSALGAEKTPLWIVGLDSRNEYWPKDGRIWVKLAGTPSQVFRAASSYPQLPQLAETIVSKWLGTTMTLPASGKAPNLVSLPPYLGRAVFHIHAREPILPPRIIGPDGRVHAPTITLPSKLLVHTIEHPAAGEYRVDVPPGTAILTVASTEPPRLSKVAPGLFVGMGMASQIRFAAGNASSAPLHEDKLYPITAKVMVAAPDGTSVQLPASLESDGTFLANWTPSALGVHSIGLDARYRPAAGGDESALFPGSKSESVTVTKAPLALNLDSPPTGGWIAIPPGGDGLNVRLTLVEGMSTNIDAPSTMVGDAGTWLQAQPLDPSGIAIGEALPVALDPDGRFSFTIPVAFDLWRGDGWIRPKPVAFKIIAAANRLADDRNLAELRLPPGAESLRVGGNPFSAGPFPVGLPQWIKPLAAALLLAVLVAALYGTYRIFGQGALLRLKDAQQSHPLELRVYDLRRDPGCLNPALKVSLDGVSKIDLSTRIRRQKPGADPEVFSCLRIRRTWRDANRRAQVEYQFKGGTGAKTSSMQLPIDPQGRDLPPQVDETWRLVLQRASRGRNR